MCEHRFAELQVLIVEFFQGLELCRGEGGEPLLFSQ